MIEFNAKHRYARISARKARLVVDLVRGLPVNRALILLERSPQRAAVMVKSVVKSAVANAEQKTGGSIDLNELVVSTARVDEGPLLGGHIRWRPAARGRAMPFRKRTCHIIISLSAKQVEPALVAAASAADDNETDNNDGTGSEES
jgi:large subunit ribosomal protein L22